MIFRNLINLFLFGILLLCSPFSTKAQVEQNNIPEEIEIQLFRGPGSLEFESENSQNPFDGADVLLTGRKTYKGKELEDFKTKTNAEGIAKIPLKSDQDRTLFNLTIIKKGLYIPKLKMTGRPSGVSVKIPVFPTARIKGSLRMADETKEINWENEKIGIMPRIVYDFSPFQSVSRIENKNINKDGSWEIGIPLAADAPTNLTFGGKEIEMRYFFLGWNNNHKNHIPLKNIKNYDWDLVVKTTTKVSGLVTDSNGSPRARVKLKAEPVNRDMYTLSQNSILAVIETDANGRYNLSFPFHSGFKLVAQDKVANFASKSFESNNQENEWNVEFSKPRFLELKAEMEGDKKPEDVKFYISSINGSAPLFRDAMLANPHDGIYEWTQAPQGEIIISAYAKGQGTPLKKTIPANLADGSTITFFFRKPFNINMEVLDAISLQPVAEPKILKGTAWNINNTSEVNQWAPYTNAKLVNGRLVYKSNRHLPESQGHRFIIHAPGYLPYDTGMVPAYGTLDQEVKLKRGLGPHGIVVDANGQPVKNCEVFLEGMGTQYIAPGPTITHSRTELTLTSDDGSFQLPAILPTCHIVAVSKKGFTQVPWDTNSDELKLILRPFQTINGILMKSNGDPWPNQNIRVDTNAGNSLNNLRTQHDAFITSTDKDGAFSIEDLPPIELIVRHVKRIGPKGFVSGQSMIVSANRDDGDLVKVGGKDWQIKGMIDLSRETIELIDHSMSYAILSEAAPMPPKRIRDNPKLYTLWRRSNKYKKLIDNRTIRVGHIRKDGNLIFENVPEGNYLLNVRLMKNRDFNGRTSSLRTISKPVEIKTGIIQTLVGDKNQINIGKIK